MINSAQVVVDEHILSAAEETAGIDQVSALEAQIALLQSQSASSTSSESGPPIRVAYGAMIDISAEYCHLGANVAALQAQSDLLGKKILVTKAQNMIDSEQDKLISAEHTLSQIDPKDDSTGFAAAQSVVDDLVAHLNDLNAALVAQEAVYVTAEQASSSESSSTSLASQSAIASPRVKP